MFIPYTFFFVSKNNLSLLIKNLANFIEHLSSVNSSMKFLVSSKETSKRGPAVKVFGGDPMIERVRGMI